MTEAAAERIQPVDSFKEAGELLRRPFTADAVRWKVQVAYPKGEPTKALIVAYIDARLAAERLNLVCPHLWSDEYQMVGENLLCSLMIDGIVRRDLGSGYKGKGLYSDAFKRAAVKFGVGVSLYSIPAIELPKGDFLKPKGKGDKATLVLTPKGQKRCRDLYAEWLEKVGKPKFGDALDHGDTPESVGDVEADPQGAAPNSEGSEGDSAVGSDIAKKLVDRVWKVSAAKRSIQLAASHVADRDVGPCGTKAAAAKAIATLTFLEAEKLDRWITKKEEGADE